MYKLAVISLLWISCAEHGIKENENLAKQVAVYEQEDYSKLDTATVRETEPTQISDAQQKQLRKLIIGKARTEQLGFDEIADSYASLLKFTKQSKDSSLAYRDYLNRLFDELDARNLILEKNENYPIETKLSVATIKSDLHFLRFQGGKKTN